MKGSSNIQYYSRQEIDTQKWDACVERAGNGLIYAYSFYLDHMARNWDALVLNEYEAVMPLPWNKKYGVSYLYQPFLTAQLGVFGNNLSSSFVESFIDAIPSRFRLTEMSLNRDNITDNLTDLSLRSNYVLDLSPSYEVLYNGYRENIKRNIRKATQLGCKTVTGFDAEKVIALALEQMRDYDKVVKENVAQFRSLYHLLQQKGMAVTYGIELNRKLISSCIFFFSHQRAYYILVGNHPDGKTVGASHMLIDAFIKDHAGKKLLLDFEGSDIRNLAFFYSSFGAKLENYPFLRINKLPFYLKWLKK
jgi:lipid II:glycine glycyltransferase (peptidoglycan interpeptide bridge formation enzyme)